MSGGGLLNKEERGDRAFSSIEIVKKENIYFEYSWNNISGL